MRLYKVKVKVKLSVKKSANLVISECRIFWEKARIPVRAEQNCVKKLINLYKVWRNLQKNCNKNLRSSHHTRARFSEWFGKII